MARTLPSLLWTADRPAQLLPPIKTDFSTTDNPVILFIAYRRIKMATFDSRFKESLDRLDSFTIRPPSYTPKDNPDELEVLIGDAPREVWGIHTFEHGYIRNRDGSIFIAVETPLPKPVTGEMMDFWFRYCDDTMKYKWWHPRDHITGTWSKEYLSVPFGERSRYHFIGQRHIVVEKIDGITKNVEIAFIDPADILGADYQSSLETAHITSCICGRINVYDFPIGYLQVGTLIHYTQYDPNSETSTLRSRFFLGNVEKNWLIDKIANQVWFRRMKLSDDVIEGIFRHGAEEFYCLSQMLSEIYYETVSQDKGDKEKR
jgi:hypothetical protein